MDTSMAAFAAYELMHIDTGIALYTTVATAAEILRAKANLRRYGVASRYVPAGSFSAPSLHY
jgi:hypothetical protein